jgi:hypothetical protein
MFRKLDLFPSLGEGRKTPEDGKKVQFQKHCVFYFLEFWMMDKVQKQSSEPFRIYMIWEDWYFAWYKCESSCEV